MDRQMQVYQKAGVHEYIHVHVWQSGTTYIILQYISLAHHYNIILYLLAHTYSIIHIHIHIQVQNGEYIHPATPFHTHCPRPRHITGVDALRWTH